jgi:hypothetical protein
MWFNDFPSSSQPQTGSIWLYFPVQISHTPFQNYLNSTINIMMDTMYRGDMYVSQLDELFHVQLRV